MLPAEEGGCAAGGRHARAHVHSLSSHCTLSGPSRPSRRHPAHLAVGARQVLRQRQHDRQHGDNAQHALQSHNSQGAQVQVGQVMVLNHNLSGMQRLGELRSREVGGSRVGVREEGSTQHPTPRRRVDWCLTAEKPMC